MIRILSPTNISCMIVSKWPWCITEEYFRSNQKVDKERREMTKEEERNILVDMNLYKREHH